MHLQSSSSGSVPSSSPSKPPRRRKNGGLPPPRPRCNECGKDFSNQSALSKHKLTHSDVRRFSCQLCGKAFKRQDHLNGHMLTHRDKKPYECDVEGCEKTYCDARSLRRHKENHHNQSVQPRISGPGGIGGGLPPLPLPGMLPNGSLVNGFSALMSMTGGCNSLPPPAAPSALSPNSSYSQISPSSYDPQQQQHHPHYPRSHMNGSVSTGGGNSGIAQSNGPNMPSSSGVGDGSSAAGYHNNFSSTSGHLLPHQQSSSQQQPPPPSPSYSTCSQPQSSPYDLHAPAPHLRGVATPATPQTPSTPTTPGISGGGGPLYQHKVQEYLAHLPPHHPHNNNRRPVSLPSTPNGDGANVEALHPPQRQVFTYPSVSPQPPNGNPYHHQVPPPSQHHQQHQVHHHNGHHPSHHHVENLHPSDVSSPDAWTTSANDGGYSSSYHQHHPQHPLTPPCNLATTHHNGDHHHLNDPRRAHSLPSTPVDPNDPSFSYNHVNHSSPYQPQHHQDLPSPYDTQHPPPHLQSHGGQHHQSNGGRTTLHFRQPPPPLTLHQGMACLPEEEDEHDKLLPLTPQDVDDVLGEGEGGGRTENFVFPTAPSTTAPSSSMGDQLTVSHGMGKTPSSRFLHNHHHSHLSSGKLIAADVVPNATTVAGTGVSLHSASDVTASTSSLSSVASSSIQQTQSQLLHHRQQFSGGKHIGRESTENYSSTTTRMDNTVSVVVPPSKLSSTSSPSSGKGEKKIANCQDDNVTSSNRDNNCSSSNTASGSSVVASAFKDASSINTERGKISSPVRMRHKPEPIYIPPHVNACEQPSLTGPSSTSGPYPPQASKGGTTIRGSPRIWEGKVGGSSQTNHLSSSLSGNPNGIVPPPPPHLSSSAYHPYGASSSNLYQILTRQQSSTAEEKERGIESFQHHHHPFSSSKFSPPPYTPPAMLSPVRTIFGGIYWHINTTPKADRMATSSAGSSPQSAQKLHFFRSKIVHHPGNTVASIPPPLSIASGTMVTPTSAEIDIMDVAQTPKTAYEPEADYHLIPETDILPHVNVGPQFQARIPEFIPNRESAFEKYKNDHADLVWDPKLVDGDTFLSSDDIDYFIEVACSSCLPGGGRNVEYAYHCLARANGDVQQALLMLLDPEPKIPETDPLCGYHYPESDVWSGDEIAAYHAALVKCDKDFSAIAREVESKSVKQCIQFYYVWKKVCPEEYRRLRVLRRKREQEGILFRHDSNNNEQKPNPA